MNAIDLPENLNLRPLQNSDYDRGFFDLLGQLTVAPPLSREVFEEFVTDKNSRIFVIEELNTKKLVATVRLNLERKMMRGGKYVCHFEDFVVDERHRSQGLGTKLIAFAKQFAKENNCYKMIGICVPTLIKYYEKQGFSNTGNVFAEYF